MKIYDAHVHSEEGFEKYDLEVVGKNIIFNSIDSYKRLAARYRAPNDCITIIFDYKSHLNFLLEELDAGRATAVKIHSRFQKIDRTQYEELGHSLHSIPINIPIIIDAFYFGSDLRYQPCLEGIIGLLEKHPKRQFVIAHCGGYKILEYFFHLRTFTNCIYELSVSLKYFEDSSVYLDLRKMIKHTDKSRIIFGSDHPFVSPKTQYEILLRMNTELGLSGPDLERILHTNASSLFSQGK